MFESGTYGAIALDDLDTAEAMLQAKKYNASVVYSQQAIEKILKHHLQYFSGSNVDDLKSHKLLKLAKATGIRELQQFRGQLSEITDCYFDARYPGVDYTVYTIDDAIMYLDVATKIVNIVKGCITSSGRSDGGVSTLNLRIR